MSSLSGPLDEQSGDIDGGIGLYFLVGVACQSGVFVREVGCILCQSNYNWKCFRLRHLACRSFRLG